MNPGFSSNDLSRFSEIQNLYAMFGLIVLSIASIIIGFVMFRGKDVFGRGIGYIVIGAGAFTIFGAISFLIEGFPVIIPVIGVILTAIWQFYIGYKMFILG